MDQAMHALWMRRRQARSDPNAFIEFCFTTPDGRAVRQATVHRELQAFLDGHPRALVELPRDHGKSFQICCRVLWELGRNPGLRVRIVCATGAIAAERVRFLRDAIDRTAEVRTVFPELRSAMPWASASFTVARPANAIGPTVTAYGIGAGSTGTRADLLICDDVVDVRSLHNASERKRVADYFENNLMNLLEPNGRFWGLFTPWHGDDLNARLKKNGSFALFRRAVGEDFAPVWPEKWDVEKLRLRKLEIGSASFARGYRLIPMAEEDTPIRPEWVRFWNGDVRYARVVLAVDPAVSVRAGSDASALVVIGECFSPSPRWGEGGPRTANAVRGPGEGLASKAAPLTRGSDACASEPRPLPSGERWGRDGFSPGEGCGRTFHILEAVAHRVPAPELMSLIDAFDRRWNPEVILFETNAAFLGIKDLMVRQARYGPRVKGVHQSTDKAARVAALSICIENGSVRLKGTNAVDESQRGLWDEMILFPFGEHDDLVDAAAMGVAYLMDRREPRFWTM